MDRIAVGIDIGGTNTAIGLVNEVGEVLVKNRISTPDHGNINKYIAALSSKVKELIAELRMIRDVDVAGIGIGAPNANYYKGTIEEAANLSFKGIVPFVDLLRPRFPDVDVVSLTNDANVATMGEMIYGGAKGMKNFVMYTLGTGVGSGIVVNGDLVYGHDGFAGECGHTTLVSGGRLCGCGGKGHLENYCSATGMKRTAFELLVQYHATDSLLADVSYNDLNSKIIYEAAVKGDKIALKVFELTGKYLGEGMADTVHHLCPEAIFLFGGPVAAGDLILKPTLDSLNDHLLPVFKGKVKVLPSSLSMGSAAIVGASALVWNQIDN